MPDRRTDAAGTTVAEPPNDTRPTRHARRATEAMDRTVFHSTLGRRMMTDAITTYLADPLPSNMLLIAASRHRRQDHDRRAHRGADGNPDRACWPSVAREFFADIAGAGHAPGLVDRLHLPSRQRRRDRLWRDLSLARSDQHLDDARLCGQDLLQ